MRKIYAMRQAGRDYARIAGPGGLRVTTTKLVRYLPNRTDAEASIGNVKDEGGVGFGVEEGLVRVHYVDSARYGTAPLVAFVSRQG